MFSYRLRLFFDFRTSGYLIRRRVIRRTARCVFAVKHLRDRLSHFKSNYSRTSLVVQILNSGITTHAYARAKQNSRLNSRHLRSEATMKFLIMTSLCRVSDRFRSRVFNNRDRKDSPLSNTYFNHSVNRTFLFTRVNLQGDKVRFVESSETSAFILRMSIDQHIRYFFGSMDTSRQDQAPSFVRITGFFQSFSPNVHLIRLLICRSFNG